MLQLSLFWALGFGPRIPFLLTQVTIDTGVSLLASGQGTQDMIAVPGIDLRDEIRWT